MVPSLASGVPRRAGSYGVVVDSVNVSVLL
jgi:hypothetical protein